MVRPSLEVADVFVAHSDSYRRRYGGAPSSVTSRVMNKIIACRTSLLGGHVDRCDQCNYQLVSYNSCRDRHCPKCQASARAEWLEARARDLLDVEYFHVVFTVPPPIAQIALQNKRALYGILLRASSETLKQIAADPVHLGAAIGFISVLHTWGQNLIHHPHVHCIVPGGGLSPDGTQWVSCPAGFFLPLGVLRQVFRGKFLEKLRRAYAKGELQFHGELEGLDDREAFEAHLRPTLARKWVVYAKAPFGGPEQVLKYLANYTHRVAISNRRLVSMRDDEVRFRWRDYRHGNRIRVMALEGVEFIRRFMLHTLPRGFVRIRHGGFLANSCRRRKLALCRTLLRSAAPTPPESVEDAKPDTRLPCPQCKRGYLARIEIPASSPRAVAHHPPPAPINSS